MAELRLPVDSGYAPKLDLEILEDTERPSRSTLDDSLTAA